MKRITTLSSTLTVIFMSLCVNSFAQSVMGIYTIADQTATTSHTTATAEMPASSSQSVMAKNGMTAAPKNYKTFTAPYKNTSAQAAAANAGYEHHPEAGLLFPGTPCDNCYELIGKRTEMTKTFEKPGANPADGKDEMVQTSTMSMHYRDAEGNWLTVKTQLQPDLDHKGVYAAKEQPVPVILNATDKFSSLGKTGEMMKFNNNLELIYLKPDGTEVSLGAANWANHTAGDEGVYVTNAWPGVDIEMSVLRGAIKTNFQINHAMPEYADGTLLVRDHMQLDKGLTLNTNGRTKFSDFLEIKDKTGTVLYFASLATAYEKVNYKQTIRNLEYYVKGNTVDIALPGDYLNRPSSAYPVIIDPLVSSAGSSTTVNGCSYNALWTAGMGCSYLNAAATPTNCTLTDIQFTFQYTALTAGLEYCGFSFYLGTCRSPSTAAAGYSWSCNTPLPGTCTSTGGAAYSIWTGTGVTGTTGLGTCVSAPQCASYNLNIQMLFYQNWLTTPACATTYYYGSQPLVITVFGHTVEMTAAGVTASPTTVCAGAPVTLSGTAHYGVPAYNYVWTPGPVSGSPATVNPTTTTTYTLTVTDLCGITTGGTVTITVNPTSPINGVLTMCTGNSTTLTDATAGGTWSSSTTGVATVGAATGIVNGVSAGTSTITYTTATGCKAFAVVTVTPLPVAITGTTSMCQGSTASLFDATTGGAWSSSNTAIATVSASGVVTGVSGGTATITYGTPGCVATITVTVNPSPDISGTSFTNPTICNGTDGTFTLSGLTPGDTYTVHYTGAGGPVTVTIVADGTGNVIITGLGAGTYSTISVTNSLGCVSNVVGPIVLVSPGVPPAPTLTNSSPICDGGIVNFTASDAFAGVTYSWSGPGGFSSTSQNPTINPAGLSANGTYTVTVTTASGCTSAPATTVVVVNPIPVLTLTSSTNPTTCQGLNGTITITVSGLPTGLNYNVTYLDNGTSYGTTIISNVSGNVIITGIGSGTYDGIYVTSPAGCVSNTVGPVVLTDPGAPPPPSITTNTPLCVGQALSLLATDAVQGGTYSWVFPNGGTSTLQNPTITNTVYADTGIYTVYYNIANCISFTTDDITLYPPIILTNITPSTAIPYGSSIQLNVDGAMYYWWRPDNGSLNNPNINNPIATPTDSTVYTVIGTSQWGCKDSTNVTIGVNHTMTVVIPSAFTPNNDGLNDIFRIGNLTHQKLVDFSVFNRWGQLVYHNTYDPKQGWDGTFNGSPQDMGVYNYVIILANPDGTNNIYKGDVTLIR